MSIGVLARTHLRERVRDIPERMGLKSRRVRDLPAEAPVYYVMALGLFMAVSTGASLFWRTRSNTDLLVEQEFYGMMVAHRAGQTLMNEAELPTPPH